ncbi:hypothetical protein [Mangrovibacterium diazotrophicum]|uniref:Uncharacterized protein n=1 Tax=Mangrovibacterium diazotrophicum TaxID=1261403 RepID=A0A419W6Q9_9BACT|nr:hypothetical protein [Mangrovibacterium diazotrophicum]RKD91135.1 hypothetical protein BC643_1484 [Mangrovibacterium diazotrophicum]
METNKIKELLERYFEGQSSLEEEQLLHRYFASAEVDAELRPYKELFGSLDELQQDRDSVLEDDLMDFILESEHKEKNKLRFLWQAVSSVAAILIVALLVFNWQQSDTKWEDTYSDPNMAYTEASKTLQYVAGKYLAGMEQLKPMGKINQAVKPLDNGLQSVNKGFREVESLQQIHKKLKQE